MRPASPSRLRDAVDMQVVQAMRQRPAIPASVADEPDDDVILRVLEGRGDARDREQVAAAPLASDKLAILRDCLGL